MSSLAISLREGNRERRREIEREGERKREKERFGAGGGGGQCMTHILAQTFSLDFGIETHNAHYRGTSLIRNSPPPLRPPQDPW